MYLMLIFRRKTIRYLTAGGAWAIPTRSFILKGCLTLAESFAKPVLNSISPAKR
jgi:hypothetical protein